MQGIVIALIMLILISIVGCATGGQQNTNYAPGSGYSLPGGVPLTGKNAQ